MNRNPVVLAVLFAVLVGLIYLVAKPGGTGKKKSDAPEVLFAQLDTSKVDFVTIRDGADTVELKRGDERWMISSDSDFPANREGVSRLLAESAGFTTANVASRKPEKYAKFEVDSAAAVEVVLLAEGDTTAHFFVGKTGPDRTSNFVRAAGRDEVFLEAGRVKSAFQKPANSWRNRLVMELETDEIRTLEVVRREDRLLFESDQEGNWSVVEPKGYTPVNALVVAMSRVLSRLTASGFPDEGDSTGTGLDEPEITVNATLFNGTVYTLEIGAEQEGKGGRFVRKKGDDVVYIVPSSRLNNFTRPASELIEPAPADTTGGDSTAVPAGSTGDDTSR